MSDDIQEYFDNLQDDHKNSPSLGIDGILLTGEITDLSELVNLEKLVISNSLITNTNLGFLNTLSNKEKLKRINFSGNQIKEVDFAELLTKFPNLEEINFKNNPLSAKSLDKLSNEQFSRLVNGIKEEKIKVDPLSPLNSPSKTISKDLLDYARKLTSRNENTQYAYQLQKFILEKQKNNLTMVATTKFPY